MAIVIAIVISLAGLLALSRIPVAQLPDIVPPEVQVSAVYPGASAEVLESTVAQPIESKIVGVDKMLYMKSTSGADGSYNLSVSFALGTDPDINTVNVNNRVQTALREPAARGAGAGFDGTEAFFVDPAVYCALQRGWQARSAVHHQLRHYQCSG